MTQAFVFATRNAGKLRELNALVADLTVRFRAIGEFPEAPEVEETGATFLENATLKALSAWDHTGLVALADDSGLCVEALGGAPGIHSARFGGVDGDAQRNNEKLLRVLGELSGSASDPGGDPATDSVARRAWFQATLALVGPRDVLGPDDVGDGLRPAFLPPELSLHAFVGRTYGSILREPRGSGGFGYDPLFWSDDAQVGFAELSLEQKNRVSHRGRAFAALRTFLMSLRG